MKKVTYLMVIMLATVLIMNSCKKKDDGTATPSDKPIITLAELAGQWNFVSLEFRSKLYTNCDEISLDTATNKKGSEIIDLKIIAGDNIAKAGYKYYDCDLHDNCNNFLRNVNIILDEKTNQIKIGRVIGAMEDDPITFQVISYNKTSKILVLKWISPNRTYFAVSGVYTFQK
jgi:hypothetical protein